MLPPLSSLTSLTPEIPEKIWINGSEIDVETFFRDVPGEPLPGHPAHSRKQRSYGPILFTAWHDTTTSPTRITHLRITNTLAWNSLAPAVKIRSDVDTGTEEPYWLEAQAAMSWTAGWWIAEFTDTRGPEGLGQDNASKLDKLLQGKVLTDTTDPDALHHTGSGNRCFFEPATSQATFINYTGLLYLDTRARKAARRCRNLVEPVHGIAVGLLASQGHPAAQKQVAEMKKTFNTWKPNVYGLTPWDEAHGDITEEHRLYRLTSHPTYLNDIISLYYTRRELGTYAHRRPTKVEAGAVSTEPNYLHCGGEPRILGLWIEFLAYTLDAVVHALDSAKALKHSTAFFQHVLYDILDDLDYALASLFIHQGLPGGFLATISGSVPKIIKDATGQNRPHIPVYMFPVILWGLYKLRWVLTSPAFAGLEVPSSLVEVDKLIEEQTKLCRDQFFTETKKVGDTVTSSEYMVKTHVVRDDPTIYAYQRYEGTALWHVPPIIEELLLLGGDVRSDVVAAAAENLPPELVYLISSALNHGDYWLYADISHAGPAMGMFDVI